MPAISTATSDFADDMSFIGFAEPEPDAVPLANSPLAYHQLNGDQWDRALSGLLRRDGTVQGRWLAPVRLPYYMQRSWLLDSDDTRQFFMATAPNADPASSLRVAVGLLEVEKSPYRRPSRKAPAFTPGIQGVARQALSGFRCTGE